MGSYLRMRKLIEYLINIKKTGVAVELFLFPLTVLSFLFRLIVHTRGLLYSSGVLKSFRLSCKVVVIGNITTGGTGKTPMVICLADFLVRQGVKTVVLTRGYGGGGNSGIVVLSDGKNIFGSAEAVGDEAYMLASKLKGVPVVCAKDRVRGGSAAFDIFKPEVIILDDGFQHLRLQRDLDIVLVNSTDPFGNGFMLPRGKLREPVSSLKRAGIVVLTKANISDGRFKAVAQEVKKYCGNTKVFVSDLIASGLRDASKGERIKIDKLDGKKIFAFCSIGDPESFFSVLDKINIVAVERIAYPDHYIYKDNDYSYICLRARQADLIVTTEKDIAKIDLNMIDKKVVVLETEVVIEKNEDFISLFRDRILTGKRLSI